MSTWRKVGAWVGANLGRSRMESEMDAEMRFHVEMNARDHEQAGMSADEAAWAARRQFGNAARLRDQTGDVMAVGPLHGKHEPPFYVCGSDQWVAGYMEGAVRTGRAAARAALDGRVS